MHGFESGPFFAIAAQPASLDQSKNDSRQHRQRSCDVSDRREIHGQSLSERGATLDNKKPQIQKQSDGKVDRPLRRAMLFNIEQGNARSTKQKKPQIQKESAAFGSRTRFA